MKKEGKIMLICDIRTELQTKKNPISMTRVSNLHHIHLNLFISCRKKKIRKKINKKYKKNK